MSKTSQRETKRTNQKSTLVAVWVPNELVQQLDRMAKTEDSDRSKLIRRFLRRATN